MTPFGQYLEAVRRSRKLQQTQLAAELGISSCYVSALEKGRKVPAKPDLLDKLTDVLKLDRREQNILLKSFQQSKKNLKIPESAGPAEYIFLHELWGHLGALTADQLKGMSLFLKIGKASQRKFD